MGQAADASAVSRQVEGGPGQEDGPSRVGDHWPGGRAAPAQLPPDGGDGPGDGGGGGEPGTEIPQGGGGGVGRRICSSRGWWGGAEVGTPPSGGGLFATGASLTAAVPSPGRHVCVQRPRAGEADREAGQGELGGGEGGGVGARAPPRCGTPSPPRALPAEADVFPQEAAPFLTDATSGFSGPGPVPAAILGPAPPGRHLRGGRRG